MVLNHRTRTRCRARNSRSTSLRVAMHNVAGILGGTGDGKLEQLLDLWFRQLRLHVVLIQEVHITSQREVQCSEVEARAMSWLQPVGVGHGLEWLWAPAGIGGNSHRGTAIIVWSDLISTQRLKIIGSKWAGHDFNIASAYLPSGNPVEQRKFIQERLDTLAGRRGGRVFIGGDFRFVADPDGLDRASQGSDANPCRAHERSTAALM
eukprot:68900-Chlamydomonas_euryale.AAC.1